MAKKKKVDPNEVSGSDQLNAVLNAVRKRSGEGSVHKGTILPRFNMIPSGVFALDYALMGGFTEGQVHMLLGWEGAGKTTQALRNVANAQRKHTDPDLKDIFVDMEGTLDKDWAAAIGVDMEQVIYIRPETGEQAVDYIVDLLKAPDVRTVILDSIPACVPQAIADRSAEDVTMGKLAALMSNLAARAQMSIRERKNMGGVQPTLFLINQFRASMALMGDPRSIPAGNALRYWCSTICEIKKKDKTETSEEGVADVVSYNEHTFVLKKCKVGNRIKEGKFKMITDPYHPLGLGAIDDSAVALGLAKKLGYVSGGSPRCRVAGVNQDFRILADINAFMVANPKYMFDLKRTLISEIREVKGCGALPPDGYLLCHDHELPTEEDEFYEAPTSEEVAANG